MTVIAWSAFCGADTAIAHFGSDAVRAEWKALTFHFPLGWQTWLIGFLIIGLIFVYDGSYRHARALRAKYAKLLWADDRPQIMFDSWGEIPHDHPQADPFISSVDPTRPPEYLQRGFYLSNDGEGSGQQPNCLSSDSEHFGCRNGRISL